MSMATTRRQIPARVRESVFREWGKACWLRFPGCTESRDMTLDHLYPDRLGGTDTVRNLRPACRHCNSARHDRLLQGRGLMVTVHISTPYERDPITADDMLVLDWRACMRLVGDDSNAGWLIMQGMWRGLLFEALRTPNAKPLMICPPPDTSADLVREWIRLGYRIECGPIGSSTSRANSCELEAKAWNEWRRSWLGQSRVDELEKARELDWRAFGLVF